MSELKEFRVVLTSDEFSAISYALNEMSCRRQEQYIDQRNEACRVEAEQLRNLRIKLFNIWNNL